MAGEVSTLSKPQLRGLLNSAIKKNLIVSMVLAVIGGVAYQVGVCNPRKQRYADFYKDYDADKEFERMKALGLFQSDVKIAEYEEKMRSEAAMTMHASN